ncbi:hypothetical protein GCM10010954_22290 [Halobacillus andaensis]|uniref:Uncharacterized protein n=1 Tax=Halobacillus andaensis TaxID=1176239 RepID=A0A917B687_HALAA|nr:hypothetical protein [Halobacillus andaensis]MBP2004263.1 hypothetical protein [Halobacillus andaensis]GGF23012.1 hypothetical protein GCM10010954_22290 [Halobacillus andaensis]
MAKYNDDFKLTIVKEYLEVPMGCGLLTKNAEFLIRDRSENRYIPIKQLVRMQVNGGSISCY